MNFDIPSNGKDYIHRYGWYVSTYIHTLHTYIHTYIIHRFVLTVLTNNDEYLHVFTDIIDIHAYAQYFHIHISYVIKNTHDNINTCLFILLNPTDHIHSHLHSCIHSPSHTYPHIHTPKHSHKHTQNLTHSHTHTHTHSNTYIHTYIIHRIHIHIMAIFEFGLLCLVTSIIFRITRASVINDLFSIYFQL